MRSCADFITAAGAAGGATATGSGSAATGTGAAATGSEVTATTLVTSPTGTITATASVSYSTLVRTSWNINWTCSSLEEYLET